MKTTDLGAMNRDLVIKALQRAGKGGIAIGPLALECGLGLRALGDHLRALKASQTATYARRRWFFLETKR